MLTDVRLIALKLLGEYENGGTYVNLSLNSHLTDGLPTESRNFLTSLLYTTVEHKITLDYWICTISERSAADISKRALDILRLGVTQIVYFDNIPDFAAVNETVKLAGNRGERAFVNGVLRRVAAEKSALPLPPPEKNFGRYLSVRYSVPLPTVRHFFSFLGEEETEALLKKFSERPPLTLRVNTRKISRDAYLSNLGAAGIAAAPTPMSQVGIRVFDSLSPTGLPGFSEGLFFVQDEASQIGCAVLDPRPGETVIDVCAAPGGKSFDAAIRMGKGRVVSLDLHESKISLIKSGAARLGIADMIDVQAHDSTVPLSEFLGRADRVICDVPCSGLGVLWKKPDLRYADPARLTALPALGFEILSASAAYVKNGGTLVYSTCTLSPAENGDNVQKFLATHPEFAPVPFDVGTVKAAGEYTFFPHKDGTDGFYVAKFVKQPLRE